MKYKTKWDLSRYFYNSIKDKVLTQDWNKIKTLADSFAKKYKGKIKHFDEKDFLRFFEDQEQLRHLIHNIGFYLQLLSTSDTQNQEVIKKNGEFHFFITDIENNLLFVQEEIKQIGYNKLLEFSKSYILKDYKNYFYQLAMNIKYILDEKTEFALNLKESSGSDAFTKMYEELTNSFFFKVKIKGKDKEVTDAEIRAFRMSADPKLRKEALKALREVYGNKKIQICLGNTYSAIVKDSASEVKLRKYRSVMSERNIHEELDDDTVDILIEEVKKRSDLYDRYIKAKARLFGKNKLKVEDLHAPVGSVPKDYDFEKAIKIYFEIMKGFDDEFYDYSLDLFEKSRADVFPMPGKRKGAFTVYEKGFESFILLNHTGKLDDVRTLFHELGHAVHGHLAQKQKSEVYTSPLSLAETASIFNEMILDEYLLPKLSKKEKLFFIEDSLKNMMSTIFGQIMYISFEKRVHELLLSGKELTYQDFNKMWREEQVKMIGKNIEFDVPAEKETGWSAVPHIYFYPFYCYAYSFGNILSFNLYSRYKKQGQNFVKEYKKILSAGGSVRPYELLKKQGFDIKKREFYKKGLKVVEQLVEEFEKLAK